MPSRFRDQLTVVPPVRIQVGRDGLATTIDWNARGVDLNASGVKRRPSGGGLAVIGDRALSGPLPTDRFLIPGTRQEFGGGEVSAMTSDGLASFKALLLATRQREREIVSEVRTAKRQFALSWAGRALGWTTLVSVASKSIRIRASTAVATRRAEVATLKENLAASRVSVSFDMDTAVGEPHRRMLEAFDQLAGSQKRWVVRTTQQIDRVRARSAAGTVVSRAAASMGRRADTLVDTRDLPLALAVQNGRAMAYFYPGFVLVVSESGTDFAVVDMKDLGVTYHGSHFTETEAVPRDAALVGKAWAKSNKNGTRDKRFKDNRELPVMLYGQIDLQGPGGLNEVFMFSRNEACREFASAIADLKRILASGDPSKRIDGRRKAISARR